MASNVSSSHSGQEIYIREAFIEKWHNFPKVGPSDKGGSHK